jgi:YidC/Oxa1 family membrane protein insertase
VLLAFYAMLSVAIELRGAPFIGWIHDLSVHDPLYITPVLMGSRSSSDEDDADDGDPMQQKMMLFMPLVMMSCLLFSRAGWCSTGRRAICGRSVSRR